MENKEKKVKFALANTTTQDGEKNKKNIGSYREHKLEKD